MTENGKYTEWSWTYQPASGQKMERLNRKAFSLPVLRCTTRCKGMAWKTDLQSSHIRPMVWFSAVFQRIWRGLYTNTHSLSCFMILTINFDSTWSNYYACITLPIRFLRSGDRRNRRLTVSKTVLYGADRTPPMGDRLGVAVGLMGSEDPADSAF